MYFNIRAVVSGFMSGNGAFISNSIVGTYHPSYAIFPVVSLSSEIVEESSSENVTWDVNVE